MENFEDLVHNGEQEQQHNPPPPFTQINVLQKIGFGARGTQISARLKNMKTSSAMDQV